jgi:methionyl-tRNA formyltransferase
MVNSDPVRVYVAGAVDALITSAALVTLVRSPAVELVGLDLDRIEIDRLQAARPDLLLSAAHRRIIRPPELAIGRAGSVGLHPSLLPLYRGSHPLWWAIRNHETEAGMSLYVLDEGIDTGPILAQRRVPIRADDSFRSLYLRAIAEIGPMLEELVATIQETGRLPPASPQDERHATSSAAPTDAQMAGSLRERAAGRLRRLARGAALGRGH